MNDEKCRFCFQKLIMYHSGGASCPTCPGYQSNCSYNFIINLNDEIYYVNCNLLNNITYVHKKNSGPDQGVFPWKFIIRCQFDITPQNAAKIIPILEFYS